MSGFPEPGFPLPGSLPPESQLHQSRNNDTDGSLEETTGIFPFTTAGLCQDPGLLTDSIPNLVRLLLASPPEQLLLVIDDLIRMLPAANRQTFEGLSIRTSDAPPSSLPRQHPSVGLQCTVPESQPYRPHTVLHES
ncbi:hypothetical protein SKAU_G00380730 [Synaphobranchus kaupii]|uniref:Uncharacterized protein n=1 Tax=Synaphobranchus kaupii TaxID=118154 RepID=A0A9Q1ICL8_SYNKA|nr:hypothetical protein SKAU_G00380730 [Synaphobranchus kaupii]